MLPEKKVPESDEEGNHQLVTETGRTTVSKDCVPQQESRPETELSSEQQPQPADAIQLGEYLQFLQPGVKCKIVSLQKNVVNVVEIADQLVAGVAVLRSAPRLAISQL